MFRPSVQETLRKHSDLLLLVAVIVPACLVQIVLDYKVVALAFFFLPVVGASYCLGLRLGGLKALLSVLVVAGFAVADPARFIFQPTPLLLALHLVVWGGFLGLTSVAVGTLSDRSKRQIQELKTAYLGVLEILSKFLENSDQYTKTHSVRVAELSCAIAAEMGLSDEGIDNIRAGALLHDVGKTESLDLVRKASALDESERKEVATHTIRGAELIRSVGAILEEAIPLVLYHHHYYAGRPGQEGPVGDKIPLGARIIAVADAYDAIVTDRPYRTGRTSWEALAEIDRCAGSQFDPKVVRAFSAVVSRNEPGAGELATHPVSAAAPRGQLAATHPSYREETSTESADETTPNSTATIPAAIGALEHLLDTEGPQP